MKSPLLILSFLLTLPCVAASPKADNDRCAYLTQDAQSVFPPSDPPVPPLAWDADGHFIARGKGVVSQSLDKENNTQTVVVKGQSLPEVPDPGHPQPVTIKFSFDADGKIKSVDMQEKVGKKNYAKTMDYSWSNGSCTLDKVTVKAPSLKGNLGIAHDSALCDAFNHAGLLNQDLAKSCADFNDKAGKTIADYSAKLPAKQTYALYTSSADGSTHIKSYKEASYRTVNAWVVQDCIDNPSKPIAGARNVGDQVPAPNGTNAE